MKTSLKSALTVLAVSVCLALPCSAGQMRAFQMQEDFGTEPLSDCYLQYYYHIPCPTKSWFWAYAGSFMILGTIFEIGDYSMYSGAACDPGNCHVLEQFRILDFAGYGTSYPGMFTVEFDVFCSDEEGCPVGPLLWTSGPIETGFGWNYVTVSPPLCITDCSIQEGPPRSRPRILVMSRQVGSSGSYPAWGMDNISTPVGYGCEMHDSSSLPVLYPRPINSHYGTIHSGYYGDVDYYYSYCPPLWFCDGEDFTNDCTEYGFIELAWRIYLSCTGPTETKPTTWGTIKSMYR